MKFIITENKMTQVQIKWLNNKFGNLTRISNVHNIGYVDEDGNIIFFYYPKDNNVFFNYDKIWWLLDSFFNLDFYDISSLLQDWIEETYDLSGMTPVVNRGQYNYIT